MARYKLVYGDEPIRGILITRHIGQYWAEYYCDNEFGKYVKESEAGLGEHKGISKTRLAKMAREVLCKPKARVFFDEIFFAEDVSEEDLDYMCDD